MVMTYQKPVVSIMEMAVASSCCTNPNCEVRDPCSYTVEVKTYTVCVGSNSVSIQY
jgi:hypothetical protein